MKHILVLLIVFSVLYAQETPEAQNIVISIEPSAEFVKGTVQLQVSADAESVEFFCDGEKINDAQLQGEKWQCAWDSSQVEDGTHELTAVASKEQQKTTSEALKCDVDNTAPQIIASVEQTSAQEAQLNLEVTDNNQYTVTLAVNGAIQQEYTAPFTWKVQPGETYKLDIEVVDAAQNVSTKQIEFSPQQQDIELEVIQAFPTMSNAEVMCKIKTNAQNVICYLSENPEVRADIQESEGIYEISWTPEDDGLYTLVLFLEAENGKTKEQLFPVRIDTNPPVITVTENESITSSDTVTIRAKVTDVSQIAEVVLFKDEQQIAALENKENAWQWQGQLTAEGVHSFHVVSKDILGNTGKSTVQKFIYDRTAPQVQNIQITPQELQIGIVNISVTYEDSISGISQDVAPRIYLGDNQHTFEVIENKDNGCAAELLITEDFTPGEYSVYIENVQDLAGNTLEKTLLGTIKVSEKSQGVGNWPLLPQNKIPDIALDTQSNVLLIRGAAQQPIVSAEDGVIVAIHSRVNEPGYVIIENLRGKQAWGYYNVHPQKHPVEKRHWALGDAVKKGDTIAQMADGKPLQLKLLTKQDNHWVASADLMTALEPQASEYEKTAVPTATATTEKINFPQKLQTSDWLLIAYLAVFITIIFALVSPKKIKA
ncbi:Ig-like domain-containing protein [Candidatus Uabimicrobium amorphum]|uniref:Uncharacterized protein n=1 Tax=Uabimicrobium amorphum TaxID=2596890 RepID=A0A5S9F6U7_UABAM|nr:Ig-like domain-containing protein [Candidatus Uabimicrobium amorphum]BBM88267.1 hypothetical protein UABAM_06688 [Candidatus Uabimicrobium amorphum]